MIYGPVWNIKNTECSYTKDDLKTGVKQYKAWLITLAWIFLGNSL